MKDLLSYWYCYIIVNQNSAKFKFSDNGSSPTQEFSRNKNGWYDGTTWHDSDPLHPVYVLDTNAGYNKTIVQGGSVYFDASSTKGDIKSYSWSNGITEKTGTKKYDTLGEYQVTLTVTDENGDNDSDTITVFVVEKILHRDFREENVYFIMTDRFCDGDPNNNNIWGDEYLPDESKKYSKDTSKTGDLSYYHGGDFKGIIKHLDYIQQMGFTAIWITPIVEQMHGRHHYDGSNGGDPYSGSPFHGYWGYNFDKIDPHLHSEGKDSDGWGDFDKLVEALHSRGMKLMVDIVLNHGHPTGSTSGLWLDDIENIFMDGQLWKRDSDPYSDGGDSAGFFKKGSDVSDLIQLNEDGPVGKNARTHLINVYKKFIDHGVDAFRIDTVAYMSAQWWGTFADAMSSHAKSKGNDKFYMVGEAWTNRGSARDFAREDNEHGQFYILDMQGSLVDADIPQMLNAFNGGSYSAFTKFSKDDIIEKDHPSFMGTYVDNHDGYRANSRLSERMYMNALDYVYLFRGIPIVYYGTEALYSWDGVIVSDEKEDVVSRWMLGERGIKFVKDNEPMMYKHIKMHNTLRLSSQALQKGEQENYIMDGDQAVFKRYHETKVAYVAMTKGAGFSYNFTNINDGQYRKITPDSPNATYKDETISVSGGMYQVEVGDNSFVILIKI